LNAYLVAGYLAIWTLIFFYLLFLQKRQQRLTQRLRDLTANLEEKEDQYTV